MPLKSITIAFAVAVLAPIVGVAAFYGVHVLDSDAPEIGSAPTPDRFHFALSISEPVNAGLKLTRFVQRWRFESDPP